VSQENVEIVRNQVEAWNQHDTDVWLSYAATEVEWLPAGPAAVEHPVYRGYEEVARGFSAVWEIWDVFEFHESEVRDLGDSVLWLGRVKVRGGSSGGGVDLDQALALLGVIRDGKVVRVQTFLAWQEALKAVGLEE
jgi:ketosteroid isomerase-like protein